MVLLQLNLSNQCLNINFPINNTIFNLINIKIIKIYKHFNIIYYFLQILSRFHVVQSKACHKIANIIATKVTLSCLLK